MNQTKHRFAHFHLQRDASVVDQPLELYGPDARFLGVKSKGRGRSLAFGAACRLSGRLSSLALARGLLQVVLRELACVLRCEDYGLRGAFACSTVLAVLNRVAVERRKCNIVDRGPGRAVEGLISLHKEDRIE